MSDHYQVLMVARSAEAEVIEAAHRALAKKYHPDVNDGSSNSHEKMVQLQAAYEVLRDPKRRAEYDAQNSGQQEYDPFSDEMSWVPPVSEQSEPDPNGLSLTAASFLKEGEQSEALALLVRCEVRFLPEGNYTEDGFNSWRPSTFTLFGTRKDFESLRSADSSVRLDIHAAYLAATGEKDVVIESRYSERPQRQRWHEEFEAQSKLNVKNP